MNTEGKMGIIAVVGYRPKKGKEKELEALMETHLPILQDEGLATYRESIIMRSEDSSIIEVFEWKSREAIQTAHTNPRVNEMWREYGEVCNFVPVATIPETSNMFAEFKALN